MLRTSATPNITVGQSLVNDSDLSRAVAQTASRTPDTTKIIQATVFSIDQSYRSPGTGLLSGGLKKTLLEEYHLALEIRKGIKFFCVLYLSRHDPSVGGALKM